MGGACQHEIFEHSLNGSALFYKLISGKTGIQGNLGVGFAESALGEQLQNREKIMLNLERGKKLPSELLSCVKFHGHLCPGLVYGYLVAEESARILDFKRSRDEEIVAVCENDSCALDAFQTLLGTTAGKGNLVVKDYGKNVYTIFSRLSGRALRFSRSRHYSYDGDEKDEFRRLEMAVSKGIADAEEKRMQKYMKSLDLISKPFEKVFEVRETEFLPPPFAEKASSKRCVKCGEMTMSTKMIAAEKNEFLCLPCA